jgi:hypothetical protein
VLHHARVDSDGGYFKSIAFYEQLDWWVNDRLAAMDLWPAVGWKDWGRLGINPNS